MRAIERKTKMSVLACAWALAGALPAAGHADTLQSALVNAYKYNPQLQSERELLQAKDEGYVQATAEMSPTASLQMQTIYQGQRLGFAQWQGQQLAVPGYPRDQEQNSVSAQLIVSQPLYTGGKAAGDMESADFVIQAGKEGLRSAEATVLFDAIQAYAGLLHDQAALEIEKANLDNLTHEVAEAAARKTAGELTRTDVEQVQVQVASVQSQLISAEGQVKISRATYAQVVGSEPGDLAALPDLQGLPDTLDAAFKRALKDNPDLNDAIFTEASSRAQITSAKGALRPNVSAQLQQGYDGQAAPFNGPNLERGTTVGLTVTVPLFAGGANSSRVRQAKDQNLSDRATIDSVRRQVFSAVQTAWQQRTVALGEIEASQRQLASAQVAFEGMQKEYSAGDRSTLDVLTAEENLVDAQLALEGAKRDAFVASASLLQATGWLGIRNLTMVNSIDHPDEDLKRVQQKIIVPLVKPLIALDGLGTTQVRPIQLTK